MNAATYTPRAGDVVRVDNCTWTGTVVRLAASGNVAITGWRGWLAPSRLTLVQRPTRAEWIAQVCK